MEGGRRRLPLVGLALAAMLVATTVRLPAAAGTEPSSVPVPLADQVITVTNSQPISIPSLGPASPYPSTVTVAGATGTVTKVEVTVTLSHSWPDDVSMLLVGPQGKNLVLMRAAGGMNDISQVPITFTDSASKVLPNVDEITPGSYRPIDYAPGGGFPSPAPTASSATALSTFNGINPTGTWSLFVIDESLGDTGTVHSWQLRVTTTGPSTGRVFNPITPQRLFDTRSGFAVAKGPIPSGQSRSIQVTGRNGVPSSGVAAVSLNVTANKPAGAGFITVYPCGARPNASNVNYRANQTVPNAVIAPVSADGKVCFYAETTTELLGDITGWFSASVPGFTSVAPVRLFDTRSGLGGVVTGRIPSGGVRTIQVAGRNGLPPSGVSAVALNVTVAGPAAAGFITVYPCGARPNASNVNYLTSQTVANAVIAPVSADGKVCFYAESATHLLADLSGWFSTAPSSFRGITPTRLVDTRVDEWALSTFDGPTGYITGGSIISIDQAPWQVRVSDGSFVCGGALVHKQWVLTAAHCVHGLSASWLEVHAGISNMNDMSWSNALDVQRVVVHPWYDPQGYGVFDLALLELSAPTTLGTVIPINTDEGWPRLGNPAMVTGWGVTSAGGDVSEPLRAGQVTISSDPNAYCGQYGLDYDPYHNICAQGGYNTGACNGDSGGPLAAMRDGRWRLVGVVSFGRSDCRNDPDWPSVFMRVSSFSTWIRQLVPDTTKVVGDRILEVQVTGRAGVPSTGVAGVSLNLTITRAEGSGYATVYPCGPVPTTSTLNYTNGQTRANAALTPLSPTGKVCVYSSNPVQVLVDLNGWFPG